MAELETSNETKDLCGAQWLLLWTTAAYTPERPTRDQQNSMLTFFGKFKDLCKEGPYAGCYRQALQEHGPPPVSSRRELMLWLCMAENRCRHRVDLPVKRCRYND